MNRRAGSGYTLIEMLLVLAILGIISAIAIPSLLGQRHRAKMIGVVGSQARTLAVQMEQYRAVEGGGVYGPGAATANWIHNTNNVPALTGFTTNPCPGFAPDSSNTGGVQLDYELIVGATGLTYTMTVYDASYSGRPSIYQIDQNQKIVFQEFK